MQHGTSGKLRIIGWSLIGWGVIASLIVDFLDRPDPDTLQYGVEHTPALHLYDRRPENEREMIRLGETARDLVFIIVQLRARGCFSKQPRHIGVIVAKPEDAAKFRDEIGRYRTAANALTAAMAQKPSEGKAVLPENSAKGACVINSAGLVQNEPAPQRRDMILKLMG